MRKLLIILLTPLALSVLLVLALRWLPPPITSFMLQSPVHPVRYQWVPAERIPDLMRKAVVASEDQRFWTHSGFDFDAMEKAYRQNQRHARHHGKQRGGSTISQQTAKNLFLWSGGGYLRKGIEAYFTVLMETLWPKQRILEIYLNVAEFGPGVYGVEAAAQAYLHKPAAQLSAAEAARLAAVLPSPRRWLAASPGPYVQTRIAWILRQMGYGEPRPDDEEPIDQSAPEDPGAAPADNADLPTPELPAPAPDHETLPPARPLPAPGQETLPPAELPENPGTQPPAP